MLSYLLLFLSAFVAATLFPFYSEVALIAMLGGSFSHIYVWATATSGNTLGAAVNYALGRWLIQFQNRSWFPFKADKMGKANNWFQKYGKWSLLLSWLPIGGDALTFLAGIAKVNIFWFLALTATGKGLRYFVIIFFYQKTIEWM